ncbi:acyl carrier protein [Amycolatopsis marina]|uniref:Acyl carrier protein n=1 Tax=Amycolatopsis marina TaxID=490629 RepID=A0A1I1A550_9PSEU|nr:acyl carrier protein [Amycolatopsis marina]SFB31620.1 acyl carrier protein [Amycolatopsis marina]
MGNDEASGQAAHIGDIRKIVCDSLLLDPAAIDDTTPLADVGVDSKRRVQLLATLEIHYEVTIDLDERDRMTTVAGIAEVLEEALRGKSAISEG